MTEAEFQRKKNGQYKLNRYVIKVRSSRMSAGLTSPVSPKSDHSNYRVIWVGA